MKYVPGFQGNLYFFRRNASRQAEDANIPRHKRRGGPTQCRLKGKGCEYPESMIQPGEIYVRIVTKEGPRKKGQKGYYYKHFHPECFAKWAVWYAKEFFPGYLSEKEKKGGGRKPLALTEEERAQRGQWVRRVSYIGRRLSEPDMSIEKIKGYVWEWQELIAKIKDQAPFIRMDFTKIGTGTYKTEDKKRAAQAEGSRRYSRAVQRQANLERAGFSPKQDGRLLYRPPGS